MDNSIQILDEWLDALKVMHIAHHKAASFYSKWHIYLGVFVIILSTAVGTSIIASATNLLDSSYIEFIAGILSFSAAALAGVQTFLGLESRVQKHHEAAASFAKTRRELEQLMEFSVTDSNLTELLNDVRSKWDSALSNAPNLPSHIHDPVKANIEKMA